MIQTQLDEKLARLLVKPGVLQAEQGVKEKEIGKNRGKQLPVTGPVRIRDYLAVAAYRAVHRRVQTHHELGQSGLSASVASRNEQKFAGNHSQIDGAEGKFALRLLLVIGVNDAGKLA